MLIGCKVEVFWECTVYIYCWGITIGCKISLFPEDCNIFTVDEYFHITWKERNTFQHYTYFCQVNTGTVIPMMLTCTYCGHMSECKFCLQHFTITSWWDLWLFHLKPTSYTEELCILAPSFLWNYEQQKSTNFCVLFGDEAQSISLFSSYSFPTFLNTSGSLCL